VAQRHSSFAWLRSGIRDDAHILTDHVLDAALCGYEYSGLPKILNVVDYPDFRLPRRPVRPSMRAVLPLGQPFGG